MKQQAAEALVWELANAIPLEERQYGWAMAFTWSLTEEQREYTITCNSIYLTFVEEQLEEHGGAWFQRYTRHPHRAFRAMWRNWR